MSTKMKFFFKSYVCDIGKMQESQMKEYDVFQG